MRRALPVFVLVVLCGVLALVKIGAGNVTKQVQTLGVLPLVPVAELGAGVELCETPIALVDDVDAVTFSVASIAVPSPRMTVRIKDEVGRRTLTQGLLRTGPGLSPGQAQVVGFPRVKGEQYVQLCVRNEGRARVRIFGDRLGGQAECTPSGRQADQVPICRPGGVRPTLTNANAIVAGAVINGDIAATFLRDEPRSQLSLVPQMLERASRFRPAFVSPALWWALLVGWLVLVPAALGVALAQALGAPAPEAGPGSTVLRRVDAWRSRRG